MWILPNTYPLTAEFDIRDIFFYIVLVAHWLPHHSHDVHKNFFIHIFYILYLNSYDEFVALGGFGLTLRPFQI